MCGATSEQKDLQAKQAAFYDTMTQDYKTVFGEHQAILGKLTKAFEPIVDAGPNQRGFSDAERADLHTQSTEGVARNFDKAKRELNSDLAARGGDDFIPSGSDNQMRGDLAGFAAAQKSGEDLQIEEADYATGHENWKFATGVLGGVASELNPTGFSNSATGAGSAAAETANQIAQASNSIWGSVIGGISGIAGMAAQGATMGATMPKPASK
jgi:hypothetical protein